MLFLAFLSIVLVTSKAWVLETSHDTIEVEQTKDVYLLCHCDSSKETVKQLEELARIRIYRIDNSGRKEPLVDARGQGYVRKCEKGFAVTHEFYPKAGVRKSFLNVTWPTATNRTAGEYGCEVDGYDKTSDNKAIETQHVIIKEEKLSLEDLKKMIDQMRTEFQEKESKRDNQIKQLEKELGNANNQLRLVKQDKKVSNLTDMLQNITDDLRRQSAKLAQCACLRTTSLETTTTANSLVVTTATASQMTDKITTNTGTPVTMTPSPATTSTRQTIKQWPEGTFAIVEPEAGCPVTVSDKLTWDMGWIQFQIASNDMVSPGNHFKKPILRTNGIHKFFRLRYCLRKKAIQHAKEWPQGSYCVNQVGGKCPSGFKSEYMLFDAGSTQHVHHSYHNPPAIRSTARVLNRVYYCCRTDAPANRPIYLPNRSPFYLSRLIGASCQKIWGMTVLTETFRINTKDDLVTKSLPLLYLNAVNVTLCYYSPV